VLNATTLLEIAGEEEVQYIPPPEGESLPAIELLVIVGEQWLQNTPPPLFAAITLFATVAKE